MPAEAKWSELLRRCVRDEALSDGRRLHAEILGDGAGLVRHVRLGNLLVQLYAKCRCLDDAWLVFQQMPRRNVYTWNILLAGYGQSGHLDRAWTVFHRMPQTEVVSSTAMLSAMVRKGDLNAAKGMFDFGMLERSLITFNVMAAAFAQNGQLRWARRVFEAMPQWDAWSWNTIITSMAQRADVEQALELLHRSRVEDAVPWTAVVAALAQKGQIDRAWSVFDRTPLRDAFCWTTMLVALAQGGDMGRAEAFFRKMPSRTTVAWNALVAANAQAGQMLKARELLDTAPQANVVSFNSMLRGYSKSGYVAEAKALFDEMRACDVVSWTTMIGAYAANGRLDEAAAVFYKMPQPNLVSWNAILTAYAQGDRSQDAVGLFRSMLVEGVSPDATTFVTALHACSCLSLLIEGRELHREVQARGLMDFSAMVEAGLGDDAAIVGNAVVSFYGRCGRLDSARGVFDAMPLRNVVSWNGLLAAYAGVGRGDQALALALQMSLEGVPRNDVTFVTILSACSHAGSPASLAMEHFASMVADYGVEAREPHYHCLVDLLGRSGQLMEAGELIRSLPFEAQMVTWKTLLAACGKGLGLGLGPDGDDDPGLAHGKLAAMEIWQIEPANPTAYVLLSNMHAQSSDVLGAVGIGA